MRKYSPPTKNEKNIVPSMKISKDLVTQGPQTV